MQASCSKLVRSRTRRFLRSRSPAGLALVRAALAEERWRAYLFGGVLRDLVLPNSQGRFRDVDIVVDGAGERQLEALFSPFLRRRTRFGGLRLVVVDCAIDIWPLQSTWAFREGLLAVSVEELARSTFMNIEGAVYEIPSRRAQVPKVHVDPLCDALLHRTIDIALASNPYPELNAIRALITLVRSEFSASAELAAYVVRLLEHESAATIESLQLAHYGLVVMPTTEVRALVEELVRHLEANPQVSVRLQPNQARQWAIWNRWSSQIETEQSALF